MNKSKELKIGAVIAYFTIALNILSGLLYTPWIIAQIGDSDYGLYTLANSLINLFLIDFGLSAATSRFVATYLAEGRQDKVDRILGTIYKLYFAIDAVILIALAVFFFFLSDIYTKLTPLEIQRFKVVYIISAAFAVVNFPCVTFTGILNAYEKFISLKIAKALYRILTVIITVAALLLDCGLYALVSVHVIVGLLTLLYEWSVIKTKTPVKVRFAPAEKGVYRELFGFSIWITVSTLAQRMMISVTPSILGVVSSSTAIAIFGIITTMENYTHVFITALNGMFMSRISRILAKEDHEAKLNELIVKVGRFQFALNGLIAVGFLILGREFIHLWVDESYDDAYLGILLLIIPNLFYYSLQIANTAMMLQKHVKIQALTNLVCGILNVILAFIWARDYGALGACFSIFVTYTVRNVGYFIAYYKLLHLNIKKICLECYLPLGIPMLLTVALGLGVNHLLSSGGWLMFAVKVVAVTLLYAVLVLLIGLKGEERRQIGQKISGMLSRGRK